MRDYRRHQRNSLPHPRLESFSNRHQMTQLDLKIEALTHEVALQCDRDNDLPEELPPSLSALIRALDD